MEKVVAYFSAEYSVADSLPIYAGGLGILAGDAVMEAGAQGRRFYAVGLAYHQAFVSAADGGDAGAGDEAGGRHGLDGEVGAEMQERLLKEGFRLVVDVHGNPLTVTVPLGGEARVAVRAWAKYFGDRTDGGAALILLDTDFEENDERSREYTARLYDGRPGLMLHQQLILGLGGVAVLEAAGVDPDIYHLNEGHMAFAGLAACMLYQREHPQLTLAQSMDAMRSRIVATKHTILSAAGIRVGRDELDWLLGDMLRATRGSIDDVMARGGVVEASGGEAAGRAAASSARPVDAKEFSTTRFMLSLAGRANGVSEIHVRAEREVHPDSKLIAVTNGIYAPRWRAANLTAHSPASMSDAELWAAHSANRHTLLDYVAAETGHKLSPDHLTVVWARRMAEYKRPALLVNDLVRLAELTGDGERPVQFVVAGHANPADPSGTELMNRVIDASKRADMLASFAYLPHYNPFTARLLVQGADLWLNTPVRGKEACGTSGMKASLNGALQFSTSDGWVDEVVVTPIGWILPENGAETAVYDVIEREAAPLFYERSGAGLPIQWINMMRANVELIERHFTAERMLKDYYEKMYEAE